MFDAIPVHDVADQRRPAHDADDSPGAWPGDALALEADPADVADQLSTVPLPDDEPWP
ncbi:hypothetical protein [Prauserella flavalba]|uniref:hypothetical protein n=1 Tax=Prauserella flavalba TaxID=1477506 RepID=UPI00143CEE19|nr:hypothetical protein [Prauserella flavalba]